MGRVSELESSDGWGSLEGSGVNQTARACFGDTPGEEQRAG